MHASCSGSAVWMRPHSPPSAVSAAVLPCRAVANLVRCHFVSSVCLAQGLPSFNFLGVVLVLLGVICDAVTCNYEETKFFHAHKCSQAEVVYFSSLLGLGFSVLTLWGAYALSVLFILAWLHVALCARHVPSRLRALAHTRAHAQARARARPLFVSPSLDPAQGHGPVHQLRGLTSLSLASRWLGANCHLRNGLTACVGDRHG
jgi:hypothetical protein